MSKKSSRNDQDRTEEPRMGRNRSIFGLQMLRLSGDSLQGRLVPPLALAIFTLVTRVLCSGSLYFNDGPNQVRAILKKVYVVQPPGYWLFNRIAGLFPNPTTAITVMNILFSVAGVVVFYYAALFFTGRKNAFLAALAYSSIFYIWFSGEVHSTYASQLFFPVSIFYALLRYERNKAKSWLLWLAAVLFAVGAGLRPSDGAFLFPMLVYFSAVRLPGRKAALFLALSLALCLAWVVPTALVYHHFDHAYFAGLPAESASSYTMNIIKVRSVLAGVNAYSLANVTRYVFPLVVAFWPVLTIAVLSIIRHWEDWRIRMLLIWILPGSLFFVLSYISVAPYLNFLSAAVLLLAVRAPRMMAVTTVWNIILFLSFCPIQNPSQRLSVNVWNNYIVQFTRYAIDHKSQPINLYQLNPEGVGGRH